MKKHREPVGHLFGNVVLSFIAQQQGVCILDMRWHSWPLETQETVKDCTPQRIAGGTKNCGCKSKPSFLYGIKRHNVTMTEVFVLFVLFGVWGLVAFRQNIDQTETGSCAKFRVFFVKENSNPVPCVWFVSKTVFCSAEKAATLISLPDQRTGSQKFALSLQFVTSQSFLDIPEFKRRAVIESSLNDLWQFLRRLFSLEVLRKTLARTVSQGGFSAQHGQLLP